MRNVIVLCAFLLSGCGDLFGESSRDDVTFANSPDGRTHAILTETNGGATTSFGYIVELHLADHQGEKPVEAGSLYGAVRSECAYGIDLHWLNSSTLALRFVSAERIKVPTSVTVYGHTIRIVVQSGKVNTAAPCGGMAFNRPQTNES